VTLTAQFAICYPTLDDRPATDRKPVFRDVAPGRHVVRCADQAGGPARDVGPIDVAPGAQMSKVVVRDATTGALSLSSRR
jgi:hypothetical protein